MRKLFSLFLALVATTTLWAHKFEVDGIYYNYLDGNNVEVTYRGHYYDSYDDEYSGEVIIPSTITYNGTTYSVTNIGDEAFAFCSSLTSVTIGNSVTNIGGSAFWECSSLTSITIPNSVKSIGISAFYYCSSLTSITIPNSVTSIGGHTFYGCSSLTSVTIPNSVTSIGERAFGSCSALTSVTIGNSVTSIGVWAFYGCSALTSIVVESGNSTYDSRENCNAIIETATNTLVVGCQNTIIPNSVTSIGGWAFIYCSNLTSIVVESGNSTYDSRENCNAIIETATNTLIVGCQNTIIPNSVTSIGRGAFDGCSSLTSITIPNSVTSIGSSAFTNCSSLASISIPNSVTSIGGGAFWGCTSLTSVTIPNSVTSIGTWAFWDCSSLKTVICEAIEVPELGDHVFYAMPLSEATLYVLAQSLDDYKAAEQWKEFGTILPFDKAPSAVENTRLQITNSTKLLRNGQIYILQDGKTYTITGQRF